MTDKWVPHHDLAAIKKAFSSGCGLVTRTATQNAAGLGYGSTEISALIQTIDKSHFYKSMTSHGDHRIWQDVYHVPSEAGTLYVKFTADVVTEFLLLSFKGKDDE